jgi:hypothetical protein
MIYVPIRKLDQYLYINSALLNSLLVRRTENMNTGVGAFIV